MASRLRFVAVWSGRGECPSWSFSAVEIRMLCSSRSQRLPPGLSFEAVLALCRFFNLADRANNVVVPYWLLREVTGVCWEIVATRGSGRRIECRSRASNRQPRLPVEAGQHQTLQIAYQR